MPPSALAEAQKKAASTTSKQTGDLWRKKHDSVWRSWGLSQSEKWADAHLVRGVSQSARVVDCINICHAYHVKQCGSSKDVLIDTSQDIERRPWGVRSMGTLTRSSDIFSFNNQRSLAPLEYLRCLGFDIASLKLHDVSPGQIQDMAGDAMGAPCISLVLLSAIAAQRAMP